MAKYKVGDKFVVETLGVDSNLSAPYDTALSRFTECQLRCIPQLVNGVDMDGYNEGTADAWEIAGLICKHVDYGGLSAKEFNEIFNTSSISKVLEMPYKEVEEKIEEWKKAKEEIKQGDYAKSCGSITGIITKDSVNGDENKCYIMWSDGSTGIRNKKELKRINNNSFIDDLKAMLEKVSG